MPEGLFSVVCSVAGIVSMFTIGWNVFSPSAFILPRTEPPTCKIQQFSVLNSTNSSPNSTIYYVDITLKNDNPLSGIYYDALNVSVYYDPDATMIRMGDAVFPAFYQGYGKGTHRVANVSAMAPGPTATFRVTLRTAVRHRAWYGMRKKRHGLKVGADVMVDARGLLVKGKHNKAVRLQAFSRGGKQIPCGGLTYYALLLVAIFISF